MVKNTHGGSKHKSFAKKHNGPGSGVIRLPQNDLEIFAFVSVCHGNHFEAITLNFQKINTFIRNKFARHNKFSNTVVRGGIVLIGLREWETPNFKNADLLEVYSQNDISSLMNIPSTNIQSLLNYANPSYKQDDFIFLQQDLLPHDPSFNLNLNSDLKFDLDIHLDLNDI